MPSPQADPAQPQNHPPLVVIVGPTAAGKTDAAIRLAERLDGEIISADSRLFYRGMDIGTAKPTAAERRGVPHHLIDVADPDETWSLAVFQEHARRAIAGVLARGRLPLLVGGTGQYVRAVVQGWQPPAVQPDPRLRRALEDWAGEIGGDALHARLASIDPAAAQAIDPRNRRRTVRALEVILATGQRFSAQRRMEASPYCLLTLGLNRPRPELYARIDARIDAMLAAGLVEEVRGLLAQGTSPDLPALSAIGYREMIDHLQGKQTLDEAVTQIRRNTRIYVRRQANWFKPDDPTIRWFEAGPQAVDRMEAVVREWLARIGRPGGMTQCGR
jgi:tRNA dimethylallyltransferase